MSERVTVDVDLAEALDRETGIWQVGMATIAAIGFTVWAITAAFLPPAGLSAFRYSGLALLLWTLNRVDRVFFPKK